MSFDYEQFKEVRAEKKGGVLTIMLNKPEASNSLSWKVIDDLKRIWTMLRDDSEVRAVVLAGEGEHFSTVPAGYQIHPVLKEPVHPLHHLELAGPDIHGGGAYHMSALKCLLEVPQPVVVAIQGKCTGLATTLALYCDIIIAADDLQLSDPHIHRAMVPGDGGTIIWPMMVGHARAKEYLLTGDSLTAAEAERIGLLNRVVPRAELHSAAQAMAERLANGPTMAIRFTKHAINRSIMQQLEHSWEFADALQILTTFTDDFKEAKLASKEKRPPRFTGR